MSLPNELPGHDSPYRCTHIRSLVFRVYLTGTILYIAAIRENDFIEIYCGEEMKRYLGFPVDDLESRTIDKQKTDTKKPKVDNGSPGGNKNMTREGTPNVVSDMSTSVVVHFLCVCV